MSTKSEAPSALPAETLASLRRYFKNDHFAERAHIELLEIAPGRARASMKLNQDQLNGYGTVQGGAIFTLADFAFAAASNSHGNVAVAVNVSITFMKAARTGTLWAEAREISKNHKLGSYTVEVRDDEQELIALFQGMVYRKSERIPA
ncbi:MAG TPA: hotdog fold thioesterase [Candidatus Acidoferrum sp.]|nr:hotdog fold thioesterase [Candidatus Acidoferrum sp.]